MDYMDYAVNVASPHEVLSTILSWKSVNHKLMNVSYILAVEFAGWEFDFLSGRKM